jgi:hypothetical protein
METDDSKPLTPEDSKKLYSGKIPGFFDTFKSIIPTIGKVSMGSLVDKLSEKPSSKKAHYKVFGKDEGKENQLPGLPHLHKDDKQKSIHLDRIDN